MTSIVNAFLYASFNTLSSVAIVFVNKSVFRDHAFNFPVALTFTHTIATWVGMEVLNRFGYFTSKSTAQIRRASAAVSASFVGFVVLTNLSLQINTVGFYQVAKILTTPAVVLIQSLVYSKSFHLEIKLSLVPVCIGVALATVGDIDVTLWAR